MVCVNTSGKGPFHLEMSLCKLSVEMLLEKCFLV